MNSKESLDIGYQLLKSYGFDWSRMLHSGHKEKGVLLVPMGEEDAEPDRPVEVNVIGL